MLVVAQISNTVYSILISIIHNTFIREREVGKSSATMMIILISYYQFLIQEY